MTDVRKGRVGWMLLSLSKLVPRLKAAHIVTQLASQIRH